MKKFALFLIHLRAFVPPWLIVYLKKQTQFLDGQNKHKVSYNKGIREIYGIGHLVKTNPILLFSVLRKESQGLRSADSVWIPAFAGMTNNKYPRLSALICG